MSMLTVDCPRCKAAKMTFDVPIAHKYRIINWQRHYEAFAICRECRRSTVFYLTQKEQHWSFVIETDESLKDHGQLNTMFNLGGFVSLKDTGSLPCPDHVPTAVSTAFTEGATCLAVQCWNAAGTMFRMCLDLATRPLLPEGDAVGLNARTRRDLGLRVPWLLANGHLPRELSGLVSCIREDGNDGAHAGTLTKEDAEDLLDFTVALLERLYTEPRRLELAQERRIQRRNPSDQRG